LLATKETNTLHLTFWEQRRSVLLDTVEIRGVRHSVNPDALFFLKDETKPDDANTTYFFFEYERSRATGHIRGESSFIRKMRAYEAYHRAGKDRERWGIPNFHVITVAATRERAVNLCRSMTNVNPPILSRRFWFTDADHIALDRPAEILEGIFFAAKEHAQEALYSLRD
jgi:hypothetical protein